MPTYDRTKSPIAPTNGRTSARPARARQVTSATAAVAIGTGAKNRILGQENQRSKMGGLASGVQMLTIPMAMSTPIRQNAAVPARGILNIAVGLQDEPACAEQAIAKQQSNAGHQRERRQERKRAA